MKQHTCSIPRASTTDAAKLCAWLYTVRDVAVMAPVAALVCPHLRMRPLHTTCSGLQCTARPRARIHASSACSKLLVCQSNQRARSHTPKLPAPGQACAPNARSTSCASDFAKSVFKACTSILRRPACARFCARRESLAERATSCALASTTACAAAILRKTLIRSSAPRRARAALACWSAHHVSADFQTKISTKHASAHSACCIVQGLAARAQQV